MLQSAPNNRLGSFSASSAAASSSAFSASAAESTSSLFGGVPKAPRDLTAVVVSTRFIALSWRRPEEDSVNGYSVYYKRSGSNRERLLNSTLEELNLQSLQPGTEYEMRVVAHNHHGAGASSQPLVVSENGLGEINFLIRGFMHKTFYLFRRRFLRRRN